MYDNEIIRFLLSYLLEYKKYDSLNIPRLSFPSFEDMSGHQMVTCDGIKTFYIYWLWISLWF